MKKIITLFFVYFLSLYFCESSKATLISNDKVGRITSIEYSSGKSITYTYDSAGNITRIHVEGGNSRPLISGTPGTTVHKGAAYTFTPTVSDPDGDHLTFAIVNLPPGWASFDSTTGRLSGTPGPSDVGTYSGIVIRVSDPSGASAELPPFELTVLDAHFPTPVSATLLAVFQGEASLFGGQPVQLGDEIGVYDPDGILCGRYAVTSQGSYGPMIVWGDDAMTPYDEGAVDGDLLSFKIWDNQTGKALVASTVVMDGGSDPVAWFNADGRQVNLSAGEITVNIPLQAGWNLISFPLSVLWYTNIDQLDMWVMGGTEMRYTTGLGSVLTTIDGQYESVFAFQNGSWTFYNPAYPAFSTLKSLSGGYGYWIKMTQAGTLTLNGPPLDPAATLPLQTGWNLVGYWGADAMTMPGALGALGTNADFTSIFGLDPVSGWQFYNRALGFGTLPVLDQGQGYWIQVAAPAEW